MKDKLQPISISLYAALALALATLSPLSSRAGGVVISPTEANLRAALAGGGTVTFATSGTITLSAVLAITNTTLMDGAGYSVTLSGNNATEVFLVYTNVQFTLNNLTVAHGRTNAGAGLYNAGGTVTLSNVTFAFNQVLGTNGAAGNSGNYAIPGEPAYGGAVCSYGTLAAVDCAFFTNTAAGGNGGQGSGALFYGIGAGGGDAAGGALYLAGAADLTHCVFVANGTGAGSGGFGQDAPGGNGGNGMGGAIYTADSIAVTNCAFLVNGAAGGAGQFSNPYQGYGTGGNALGGGLFNAATSSVSECTFAGNSVSAGPGGLNLVYGAGQVAQGGSIWNGGWLVLSASTVASNTSTAGAGAGGSRAGGGPAYGGGVFNGGAALALINCTLVNNVATGGPTAEPGGNTGGNSYGGGVYGATNGLTALTNCTLSGNSAIGGLGTGTATNGSGYGGNIAQAGVVELIETIVTAGVGNNAYGSLTDLGYNISSDASCAFSAPGSLNNTDPKLQPLANNGGPTLTMALWPGSPAIDAGISLPGITTDQRGVPRPYGPAPDIGAYEWNGAPIYHNNFNLTSLSRTNGSWYLSGVGPTNQSFRVLVTSNFASWTGLSTNNTGPFGAYVVRDPSTPAPDRFYKTVSP